MAFTGMDIGAVRTLASQLTNTAHQFEQLMNQTTQQLNNVQWVGPDRERFVSDWQSQHCAALRNICQAINEASTRATQNASEQEQVSNNG